MFIQIVEFNCDHCGRNFTQNTGLKLQISAAVYENLFCSMMQFESSHTKCSWNLFMNWIVNTVANISPKHSICGKSFTKSKPWSTMEYDCDSCGKSSTQFENLNKNIMEIHARQRNYKYVSCGKYITKWASLIIHIKIIHQGQRNFPIGADWFNSFDK